MLVSDARCEKRSAIRTRTVRASGETLKVMRQWRVCVVPWTIAAVSMLKSHLNAGVTTLGDEAVPGGGERSTWWRGEMRAAALGSRSSRISGRSGVKEQEILL